MIGTNYKFGLAGMANLQEFAVMGASLTGRMKLAKQEYKQSYNFTPPKPVKKVREKKQHRLKGLRP